jgi:hypothetical protein
MREVRVDDRRKERADAPQIRLDESGTDGFIVGCILLMFPQVDECWLE